MNRFLVANDDGINALGIQSLIKRLTYYGEVYVCAPPDQRSCTSQSMTLRDSIIVEPVEIPGVKAAFQCSGTPADCVKFGIQWADDNGIELDYVFSGINHGANGGTDIRYSGTMGAAMEGAMSGIKSIALSVFSHEATEFEYILDMIPELLDISGSLDSEVVLNVNSPNLPKWKIAGVKFAGCGPRSFVDRFIVAAENENSQRDAAFDSDYDFASNMKYPAGKAEYKYNGTLLDFEGTDESIDLGAIAGGYATITPIKVDATDYESLIKLNKINDEKTVCIFLNYQEKLLERVENKGRVLDRTRRFAECAEILDLKIIHSKHFAEDLGEIAGDLKPILTHSTQVDTISFDLFDVPGFSDNMLINKGSNIVIAGLEAHASVQETALAFAGRGYRVTILKDCCSSRSCDDLSAAMELLSRAGCTVTTYESFVYNLIKTSKHESIEELRAIINAPTYEEELEKRYLEELENVRFEDDCYDELYYSNAVGDDVKSEDYSLSDMDDDVDYDEDDEEYRQVSLNELMAGARIRNHSKKDKELTDETGHEEPQEKERIRFRKSKKLKRIDRRYIPEPAERLIPDAFSDE